MLERFIEAKQDELAALRAAQGAGTLPPICRCARPRFSATLKQAARAAVIAEYKVASPSRGLINDSVTPRSAAMQYAAAGADAVSILTEEKYFRGRLENLSAAAAAGVPMLRKDFIFDWLQIRQTAATPAAAVLLIVRLTPDAEVLRALREAAESYGIEAVVEVCADGELSIARESGAKIIQVNSRDLETLAVDRRTALHMARARRAGEIWIAASGIASAAHIVAAHEAGYDAVLIGTALMEDGRPGRALRLMLGGRQRPSLCVKVCGMTSQEDVTAAADAGADMVGFIFAPESKRAVTADAVAKIETPATVKRVGVVTGNDTDEILRLVDTARLDMVQMHGGQSDECCAAVAKEVSVARVLWIGGADTAQTMAARAIEAARCADIVLIDGGTSGGGSGVQADVEALTELSNTGIPWILAGGLDADNVEAAVSRCDPDGVDLNSGVEVRPGVKDAEKMKRAIKAARMARKVLQVKGD